jgi:hypothetical protein
MVKRIIAQSLLSDACAVCRTWHSFLSRDPDRRRDLANVICKKSTTPDQTDQPLRSNLVFSSYLYSIWFKPSSTLILSHPNNLFFSMVGDTCFPQLHYGQERIFPLGKYIPGYSRNVFSQCEKALLPAVLHVPCVHSPIPYLVFTQFLRYHIWWANQFNLSTCIQHRGRTNEVSYL